MQRAGCALPPIVVLGQIRMRKVEGAFAVVMEILVTVSCANTAETWYVTLLDSKGVGIVGYGVVTCICGN